MAESDQLVGRLEDSKIPNAMVEMAKLRASALLRECARVALSGTWQKGTASKFLNEDVAEFVIDTNQGRFVINVRRG